MTIQCNEISQVVNELLIAFDDCNKIKNSDLRKLVELVSAVNTCSNGGVDYGVQNEDIYEPLVNQEVTYPINSYHSICIAIISGNISKIIDGTTVIYPTGSVLKTEFTNLNQTPTTFTVIAGSTVVVTYLTETI